MASGTPSLDGSGSNGMLSRSYTLNSNTSRDYDSLKQQCDMAMSELTLLKRQHSETTRRCDHAMKELDYYRGQHRAAMNQLEASVNEKQRLDREVQALRTEVNDLRCQQEVLVSENGNADSLYVSLSRRNEAVRDDYEALRKRYDDLLASHSTAIAKLELAQEETSRLNKQCEELSQERNNAVRERNGLKQQCTAAIRQWDMALRERNEYREALAKVQQQHEEAVKEVNQAMAVRMKASKDIKRLTDERNAAMQEYTLIMSERDTVHKEMEKLSDDLTQEYKKTKILENENKELIEEKKALNYQMETLRREIASALHDRDKALKECNDLREKFGEYNAAKEDSRDLIKSRLECVTCPGESSARKEVSGSGDSRSLAQRQRLDNLDQANQELETLRKSLDKVQSELTEAIQEAEVSKRRRDWAFSERDKIVLERESIRTLCDKLRKERDRAVSDLAEALRDSDDLKKQRNEACKELKTLKETLEQQLEKEASVHQFQPMGHNHSHDSAIDTDMQEWETEVLDMDLSGLSSDGELGFELVGGRDDPHYPNDSGVYVASVTKGSIADGKLRVNDCISRVNNMDCTSVSKRMVLDTVRASLPRAHLVVRRRRMHSRCLYTTQLPAGNHGLALETGMYISKISPGSSAAKEGNLAVGDRVLSINNKTMDGIKNCHEAMSILNDDRTDITITVLKSIVASQNCNQDNPENYISSHHQRKVNSSSQTEDLKHYSDDFVDRNYILSNTSMSHGPTSYKPKSTSQEKNNAKTWNIFREKISNVRGRRHSKERNRTEEKSKYRNSSPNALTLSNSFDHDQAIAELDSVIESYHGNAGVSTQVLKRSKRRGKESSVQEKNGGTWPKARSNVIQNPTGTIINPRNRERAPLSLLLNGGNHDSHCCNNNRNSTPLPISVAPNLNRHTVYKSMDNSAQIHFPSKTFSNVNESFDKLRERDRDRDREREREQEVNNRLSVNLNSNNSLDYSVKTNQIDKDLLDYYSKKTNKSKYSSDSESNDISSLTNVPSHARLPSLYGQPRIPNYPFHPHPHPHNSPLPLQLPSSQSGESFCFEPSYPVYHSHNPSIDAAYKNRPLIGVHSHVAYRDSNDLMHMSYTHGYESGTFPRKKENQRFRIPSNPSVTSKSSAGKVSNGSIERTSDRGSPMPTFHVEVLSPGTNPNKRNSLPDYCWPQKPSPGELRRVHIDKSSEPLGIQISCPDSGGIFVSTVNEHSLASQVGLQIGDQLLEVCGINMRSATYKLAANVLRQCGNSITMLVQYSPDKYHELEGSGSCSSSAEEDGDGEPTPCNSPRGVRKTQPQSLSLPRPELDTGQNTLTRSQIAQVTSTLHRQNSVKEPPKNAMHEPRYLLIETQKRSNLGISLVGGNAVGIFVHSVQPESLADNAGLRTGDQILEYNGTDLRHATAEEAAYELAKPADKVTVLAHYKIDRYNEIKDKPGDSLYVRCGFDRSELTDSLQLCFNKDDVLYVDNTMFNGVPGNWRAWRLDSEGHRHQCGIIPSKYKVEDDLLLRRSLGDLEGRGSTSARRSFFRRKKHQRNGSRDSKELASFSNVAHTGWYSDSGTLHEDVSLCSYQRVERLDYTEYRPVLVLGPLAECVVDKLVTDFPDQFRRCTTETRHCPQAAVDQEMAENLIIDYKRKGSYFECTTVASIKAVCDKNLHCIIDISVTTVEKLHRQQIYPIVLLIKFKSTKQIKEVKDTRYPLDKVTAKAAKEMYEHGLKLEAEYKHRISTVIPAGVNIAYMCTQVKAAVDVEQNKSLWVPCQNS